VQGVNLRRRTERIILTKRDLKQNGWQIGEQVLNCLH
jgi:hypothetical protein